MAPEKIGLSGSRLRAGNGPAKPLTGRQDKLFVWKRRIAAKYIIPHRPPVHAERERRVAGRKVNNDSAKT